MEEDVEKVSIGLLLLLALFETNDLIQEAQTDSIAERSALREKNRTREDPEEDAARGEVLVLSEQDPHLTPREARQAVIAMIDRIALIGTIVEETEVETETEAEAMIVAMEVVDVAVEVQHHRRRPWRSNEGL